MGLLAACGDLEDEPSTETPLSASGRPFQFVPPQERLERNAVPLRVYPTGGKLWLVYRQEEISLLYSSEDDGHTQQLSGLPAVRTIKHVRFGPEGKNGLVFDGEANVYRTMDGGENWSRQHIFPSQDDVWLTMAQMSGDLGHGALIADCRFYVTKDGAHTWQEIRIGTQANSYDYCVKDVMFSEDMVPLWAKVWRSGLTKGDELLQHDGQGWLFRCFQVGLPLLRARTECSEITLPEEVVEYFGDKDSVSLPFQDLSAALMAGQSSFPLDDAWLASPGLVHSEKDDGRIWFFGGVVTAYTDDNGMQWRVTRYAVEPWLSPGVEINGRHIGKMPIQSNILIKGSDRTGWETIDTDVGEILDIVPASAGVLLAAGEGVYLSDDDGATWKRLPSLQGTRFFKTASRNLWLAGAESAYFSSDGGTSWVTAQVPELYRGLECADICLGADWDGNLIRVWPENGKLTVAQTLVWPDADPVGWGDVWMSAAHATIVFLAEDTLRMKLSFDGGESWETHDTKGRSEDYWEHVHESPDANLLLISRENKVVFVGRKGGAGEASTPTDEYIDDVCWLNEGLVLLYIYRLDQAEHHVIYSDDYGESWHHAAVPAEACRNGKPTAVFKL